MRLLHSCNDTVVAFQKFQMYCCEQLPVNGYSGFAKSGIGTAKNSVTRPCFSHIKNVVVFNPLLCRTSHNGEKDAQKRKRGYNICIPEGKRGACRGGALLIEAGKS